jgi:hypothetical protein
MAGAAIAFSLRATADFLLLAGLTGTLRQMLHALFVPVLLQATAFVMAIQPHPGRSEWTLLVVAYLLILMIWAWRKMPAALTGLIFDHRKWRGNFPAKS